MESAWLFMIGLGVFLFAIIAYVVFMVFLPEWVGITGKVALDAERQHQDPNAEEKSFWTQMGQVPVKAREVQPGALPDSGNQ